MQLTIIDRLIFFSRMNNRVQIINITAINTVVESAQLAIEAVLDERRLDLVSAELGVGEHGQVGGEGAQDAVAAEEEDAVFVEFHVANDHVDGGLGLILEDFGLVLGRGRIRCEFWLVEGLRSLTTGKALVVTAKRPSARESLVRTCMLNWVK